MSATLKPYQEVSRDFLAKLDAALLADDPRVGKTAPTIRAADKVRAKLVVVVCPAHVSQNWIREIEVWRRGGWLAVVVGYPMAAEVLRRVKFAGWRIDILVVDESHYAKNYKAGRTKAIYGEDCDGTDGFVALAGRTWCLSGTPQPNHPGELWPMLHAIAPHIIMRANGRPLPRSLFEAKYCSKMNNGFGNKIVGSKNAKELKAKMASFVLRRTRTEALGTDLQPWTQFMVAMPANMRKELRSMEDSPEGQAMLRALAREGIAGLKKEAGAAAFRRAIGLAKVPGIAEWVTDELENGMKKVVIGAHHTEVIERLRDTMSKFKPLVIDGREKDKMAVRDKFMLDASYRILIGQNIAAGTGLDFSAADDFISAEPDYVGDNNEQISARIFNVEKPKNRPCFRRFAVLSGCSLDFEVINAASRKTKDSRKIFS